MADAEAQVADAQDDSPSSEEQKTVPYDRFKEVIEERNHEREERKRERERLEARLSELESKAAKPAEREYSRTELQQAVDNGQISEVQMQDILDQQREKRLRRELREEMKATISATSKEDQYRRTIEEYRRVRPDLGVQGSEDWKRGAEEFQALANEFGRPKPGLEELRMEAMALRTAFGDVSRLRAKGKRDPDPYQETGSAREQGGSSQWGKVEQRVRDHFQKQIDRGVYKGRDDPKLVEKLKRFA